MPAAFGLIKSLDRSKVADVNKRSISLIFHRAIVLMIILAWSSLAFCGEIHEAAKGGDLEKVKALLKANPDLVSSKDQAGATPLH